MVALIVAPVILGLIPAAIASAKGRGFLLWWLFGALLFIVALPYAIFMPRRNAAPAPVAGQLPAPVEPPARMPPPPRTEPIAAAAGAVHIVRDVHLPAAGAVLLRYRDAHGVVTDRTVTLRTLHVDDEGPHSISAVCHERHAVRTFRLDRVVHAADAQTGEIIPDLAAYAQRAA